jgi:hypothetical protein
MSVVISKYIQSTQLLTSDLKQQIGYQQNKSRIDFSLLSSNDKNNRNKFLQNDEKYPTLVLSI